METIKTKTGDRFKEKVRLPNRKTQTKTFRTKTEAKIWKRKVETEKTQGVFGVRQIKRISFREIGQIWFKAKVENFLAPRTVLTYSYNLKATLNPAFGDINVDKLNQGQINHFKNNCMEKGLNAKTLNCYLSMVNRILDHAIDEGYLSAKPYRKIGILPYKSPKLDFYAQEEIQKLLNANHGFPIFPILYIAFNIGARRGELLGLRWDRVNFETKEIEITRTLRAGRRLQEYTKVKKDNFFPMFEHVEKFMIELKNQCSNNDGFVFIQPDGRPYEPNHFSNRMFRAACERAGVRYLRLHDIRHSYVSHFAMNGGNIRVLQKLLGHSQIQTTEAYSHLSRGFIRESSNVVNFSVSKG